MTKKEVKFYKEKNLGKNNYSFVKVSLIGKDDHESYYDVVICMLLDGSLNISKSVLKIDKFMKLPYNDKKEYATIKKEMFDKKFKETLKLIK